MPAILIVDAPCRRNAWPSVLEQEQGSDDPPRRVASAILRRCLNSGTDADGARQVLTTGD